MNENLKVNRRGLNIIIESEVFRSKPYLCPANKPTIGYGTTIYPNGKKVTLNDTPINQEQAFKMLVFHCDKIGEQIKKLITKQLRDNQFSSLVSLVYNIGIGNFKKSSALKAINVNPNDIKIADYIQRWNKITKDGKKVTLQGLINRRKKEAELYFLT